VDVTTRRKILALLLVVSYLGLAALGAACLFGESAGDHAAHHHAGHTDKPSHSALCAWACQAGPSAVLISLGGVSFALYILFWSVASHICVFRQVAWATARPRAPPFASR
jgi:hypothetical protein